MNLKINIFANYLGTLWSAFSIYFFLPFYLKILDKESFGLVLFSTTLQSLFFLFDAGFSASIKRKLAINFKNQKDIIQIFSYLKATERLYIFFLFLTVSIALFCIVVLKINWFNSTVIPKYEVNWCIILMIISSIFQLFISLYNGGLQSRGKQILSNVLQFFLLFFRNGVVIVFIYFFPSPLTFIIWQLVVVLFFIFIYRYTLLSEIGFNKLDISKIEITWIDMKFIFISSMPFFILTSLSTINFQVDKIMISWLLPISDFGTYVLIFNLGLISVSICSPIASAITPKFIEYFYKKKFNEMAILFHMFSRITTIISATLCCVFLIYTKEIIYYWTSNLEIINKSSDFSYLLIIAGFFLSVQIIPYTVGVASLSLKKVIVVTSLSIVISFPMYYILIIKYGVWGAAFVWLISNISLVFLNVFFYIKNVLNTSYSKWLLKDFLFSSMISFSVVFFINYILIDLVFLKSNIIYIIFLFIISLTINMFILINNKFISILRLVLKKKSFYVY